MYIYWNRYLYIIPTTKYMIKIVICALFVSLSLAVTVEKFAFTFEGCNYDRKIVGDAAQCEYNIVQSELKNPDCGRDLAKSIIC